MFRLPCNAALQGGGQDPDGEDRRYHARRVWHGRNDIHDCADYQGRLSLVYLTELF